jgi:hypothetical protein
VCVQAQRLRLEEEQLMRARWELDRIEEERRAMEEQRKKLEFGLVEILASICYN